MGPESSPIPFLLAELLTVREAVGSVPSAGSPADVEERSFARAESVRTAYSHGLVAVESAADHLFALDSLIDGRQSALAPWTCARGLLEASALATWLLDPAIDAEERVGRSMAVRYETLREQRKLAQEDDSGSLVAAIDRRVDEITTVASQLGYPPINDRHGNRIGIGRPKPNITDLVTQQLGARKIYRILSGVAHCDPTTVSQLGFAPLEPSPSGGIVKRLAANPEAQGLLRAQALDVYAHAVWPQIVQYGADRAAAAVALDKGYDACGLANTESVRFWRRCERR